MRTYKLYTVLFSLFGFQIAQAGLQLPAVFSDHMILQYGVDVPVWGLSDPEATITVVFGNRIHN